jgi:hypothetical protein
MEIILLIVFTFVVWVMGVKSGWDARERHARKITKQFLDIMQEAEQEEPSFINITIEKHNNVFYVYDKETNEFMAQGSTQSEVENNLRKRYPGKSFGCSESVLTETGFFS